MRKDITVSAEVRDTRGKNEARRTRAPRPDSRPWFTGPIRTRFPSPSAPRKFSKILRSSTGYNTIFNLAVNGGETTPVMVVDEQVDPIRGNLLHADLKRIDLTKRLRVSVPVHTQASRRASRCRAACSK